MTIYSKHWFMFSFSLPEGESERTIANKLELIGWQRRRFEYTEDYAHNYALQNSVLFYGCGAMFDDESCSNRVLTDYEYLDGLGGTYVVQVNGTQTYDLTLRKVELRIYENFVGVLVFHVENTKYVDYNTIQDINKYGRQIFPPYLKGVYPQSIEVVFSNGYKFKQDFSQYEQDDDSPFHLPEFVGELLPWEFENNAWLCDDSMFYVCLFYDNVAFPAKKMHISALKGEYAFVVTSSNVDICRRKNTVELDFYGTLCVNLVELVLAQKACYLWFTRIKSVIASELQSGKLVNHEFLNKLQQLDKDVLMFVNNIYYRDISPKKYTNKLYKLIQKNLEIKKCSKELQKEIQELYQYAETVTDSERNKRLLWLQIVVTIATVLMLIMGFF